MNEGLPQFPNYMVIHARKDTARNDLVDIQSVSIEKARILNEGKFDTDGIIVNQIARHLFANYPSVLQKIIDTNLETSLQRVLEHAIVYDKYVQGRYKEEGRAELVKDPLPNWAWGMMGFIAGLLFAMFIVAKGMSNDKGD